MTSTEQSDHLVPMPLYIGWGEIAVRLALTVVAGILIGVNRSEHGHAAGLRTTLLVCLAASFTMLQVNLLLPMTGKTSSSFAVMDLMRLPLGILSGMGFIGAGAIVRKDDFVRGLTTAATFGLLPGWDCVSEVGKSRWVSSDWPWESWCSKSLNGWRIVGDKTGTRC